ncbi:MAG: hypothetical protein JOZ62_14995 [Acidobacteriaceae bacterium]|nr:hypothetical protein [Acidobacteriaceae bacterium]
MTVDEAQAMFADFNRYGGDVYLVDPPPNDDPFFLDLADSFEVVRVAPHAGDSGGADFWVLWRAAGYENQSQVHLLKIVETWKGDDGALFLREENGRVTKIARTQNPAKWRQWTAYKKQHAEQYSQAEADTRAQAVQDANTWR